MIKPIIVLLLLLGISCGSYSQDSAQSKHAVFRIARPKEQNTSNKSIIENQDYVIQAPLKKVEKVEAEIHNVTTNHYIYLNDLLYTDQIGVRDSSKWKVISFDLTIKSYDVLNSDSTNINSRLSRSIHSDDGLFSKTIIKAIKKGKQGKFEFSNLVALTSSGQKINLDELILYVYASPNMGKSRQGGIQP